VRSRRGSLGCGELDDGVGCAGVCTWMERVSEAAQAPAGLREWNAGLLGGACHGASWANAWQAAVLP
jgi:hypothetical protein